jgi:serine/threonine protein phosphatase 1
MRILVIGDVHGCSRALDGLLAMMNPRPEDLLITLGDYVDRGPDSRGVLDRFLHLRATRNLIALRGNHEQMMGAARAGGLDEEIWLGYGGRETLASYAPAGRVGTLADVPPRHWEFMDDFCVDWYETDRYLFVHGNLDPALPLAEQPRETLYYAKFEPAVPHASGKTMICGHTAQKSGVPADRGFAVCIDTWVYGDGWLTGLELPSGQIWQADQRGRRRTARLSDFAGTVRPVDDVPVSEEAHHG